MVDVSEKPAALREARARGYLVVQPETLTLLTEGRTPKGDVLATARIAGIQAAKRTADLIPMCHPIALSHCDLSIEAEPAASRLRVKARARATDRTGVEMEALTAVAVAGLTLYDMLKAVDKSMVLEGISVVEKRKG